MMRTEARVTYMAYPARRGARRSGLVAGRSASTGKISRSASSRSCARYATLGIGYARETPVRARAEAPREPRSRAVRRRLSAVARGRCADRRASAPCSCVNITDPCWIWRGADLTQVKSIRATVGQIPFNFQIGADAAKIPLHKPATQVRRVRGPSRRLQAGTGRGQRVARSPRWPTTGSRRCRRIDLPSQARAARPLLHVHASQGRSHLGDRRPRARRILTHAADHPRSVRRLVRAARRRFPTRRSRKACWAMAWPSIPSGNELRAPCDGEIISVAAARHALALRAAGRRRDPGARGHRHRGARGRGLQRARAQGRPRARRRSAAHLRSRSAGAQGAEPHDAGDRHQRGSLPRSRSANTQRAVASGDALFELEQFAAGEAATASRATGERRWSAKPWWSRTRMASTRGPRR